MNSHKFFLQACALALVTASTSALAGAFPSVLSGNTTSQADSIFLGAPNDVFVGLGADEVPTTSVSIMWSIELAWST